MGPGLGARGSVRKLSIRRICSCLRRLGRSWLFISRKVYENDSLKLLIIVQNQSQYEVKKANIFVISRFYFQVSYTRRSKEALSKEEIKQQEAFPSKKEIRLQKSFVEIQPQQVLCLPFTMQAGKPGKSQYFSSLILDSK